METKPKSVFRMALIMLFFSLSVNLFASQPDSAVTNCDHYGTAYALYDNECYFYIVLDNGLYLQPEKSSIPERVYPSEPFRVSVAYDVIDSIASPCGTGLLVYLTCLELIDDSTGCYARYTYERLRCYDSIRCMGYIYQFHNYSGYDVVSSHWDFGDGSGSREFEPVHTYERPGVYEVCLTIMTSDSCTSQYCSRLYIEGDSSCYAYFTYDEVYCDPIGDIYCGEYTYQFNNLSSGNWPSYSWNFGDGTYSSESDPMHSFTLPGTYEVCLSIFSEDSCSDTYCVYITVGDTIGCMAMFEYYSLADCGDLGADCLYTNERQFIDLSHGNITEWWWDFGDGTTSTEQNPLHVFPGYGEYTVCLSINSPDSCYDTYCTVVAIEGPSECSAYFDYCNYSSADSTSSDNQYVVGFMNLSEGDGTYFWWDFGDGGYSSEENPAHVYTNPGTYEVCLTISSDSGCYDTYCASVVVGISLCSVDFNYTIEFANCIGFEPAYVFTPVLDEPVWFVQWDFGDGAQSYDQVAAHSYAENGAYTVCVEVYYENNCYASQCKTVWVTETEQDSIWYEKCDPNGLPDELSNSLSVLEAYPNPASDVLNLVINAPENMEVNFKLFNVLSQVQYVNNTYSLSTGENSVGIDLNKIETGNYIYLIYSNDRVLHGKISIVK